MIGFFFGNNCCFRPISEIDRQKSAARELDHFKAKNGWCCCQLLLRVYRFAIDFFDVTFTI
jgi:hypothetical protein